jgi:hypothetical protein
VPPQHLPCEAKSGLAKQFEETKHELVDLLRQREGDYSMVNEPKELQHLLKQSNIRVLTFGCNIMAGAVLAGTVTALGLIWLLGVDNPGNRTPTGDFWAHRGSPPTMEKYVMPFGHEKKGNGRNMQI